MDNLTKLINGIKSIGWGNAIRTLIHTNLKRNADKKYWANREMELPSFRIPGKLADIDHTPDRVVFTFQHEIKLEIMFLAENLVRTTWTPGQLPVPYALTDHHWPEVSVEVNRVEESWVVSSSGLSLKIHPCGSISYLENGRILCTENPPRLEGSDWTQTAELEEEAKIFGMGEQANKFDLRGNRFELWNTDPGGSYEFKEGPLYMPLPVFFCHSDNGSYLKFYENSHKGNIGFFDDMEVNFLGGALRSYFISGDIKQVIKDFTALTGRASLPPLWSFGFHQSRWGYKSEADIRRIAKGYIDNELSISSIHLDIDYMDGFRVFTVDEERYPDLKVLSDDMEDLGIKLVTILDPGVKIDPEFELYQEGITNDYFVKTPQGKPQRGLVWPGWSVFPDFTNPKTRDWWKSKYPKLLDQGIAGIWHDMNEPASFVTEGDATIPLSARHDLEGRGGDHLEAHNLYGLMMDKAGHEALSEQRPDRRPWLLTRSGWVGVQRYAWHWTGDIETSWDALRMTVSGLLNLGISGISHSGSDIGGFSGKADTELFLRWFQLAAFTPFFRNHAACHTPDSEPWEYGPEAVVIIREVSRVREQLLPYIYTSSWQASEYGYPLMRPLFWEDIDLIDIKEVEECYFFGDHILIAPILEEGQTRKELFLPEGYWINFKSGKVLGGNQTHELQVEKESIPVFVRSGAVIPMNEDGNRVLNLFAACEDSTVSSYIYSDEGDGYGPSLIEKLISQISGQKITIKRKTNGDFRLVDKTELRVIGIRIKDLVVDGRKIDLSEQIIIDSDFDVIQIEFDS